MRPLELVRRFLAHHPGASFAWSGPHSLDSLRPAFEADLLAHGRSLRAADAAWETAFGSLVHHLVLRRVWPRQCALIERRLDALASGRGGILLVRGDAGMGKSAVASDVRIRALSRGIATALARCHELGGGPYQVWQDLLAQVPAGAGGAPLPPPFGRGKVAPGERYLHAAVARWLESRARTTSLALVVEDMHWADADAADMLDVLSARLASVPVLFVVTDRARTAPRGAAYPRVVARLFRDRVVDEVRLEPLLEADTGVLARAWEGPVHPSLAAYLHRRCNGHLLFTVGLLRGLAERGLLPRDEAGQLLPPARSVEMPRQLEGMILAQVDALGAGVAAFLEVASVLGEEWDRRLAAGIARQGPAAARAIERALEAGVLRDAGGGERLRFSHELVRDALYGRIAAARRRHLHSLAAAALPRTTRTAAARAHHWFAAGDWPSASRAATEAGDALQRSLSTGRALRAYAMALTAARRAGGDLPRRAVEDVLERIGRLHLLREEGTLAERAFKRMEQGAVRAGDKAARARALAELALVRVNRYRFTEGEATAREALRAARSAHHPGAVARARMALGKAALVRGRFEEARVHGAAIVRAARQARDEGALSYAFRQQAYEHTWQGRYEAALGAAAKSLDHARRAGDALLVTGAFQVLGYVQVERGQYVEAYRSMQSGLGREEAAEAHHHQLPRLLNQMGYLHLELGDAESALRWDTRALDASRSRSGDGSREMECYSILNVATDLLALGRRAEARGRIAEFEAIKDATEFSHFRYVNRYHLLLAEAAVLEGDGERAVRQARNAQRLGREAGTPKNVARGLFWEGAGQAALGKPQDGIALMEKAIAIVDGIGHGSLPWTMRIAAARAQEDAGMPNEKALEGARGIIARIDGGLRGTELEQAAARSTSLNAARLLLAGATAATAGRGPFERLTRREKEVLRLVATGATDRAVAQALRISVRTVNTHMASILGKTGSPNRTAAARWALRYQGA